MKTCTSCKIEKDLSQFTKRSASKDGLFASCKTCQNTRKREWNKSQSGKPLLAKANRAARLKNLYGISESTYRNMLMAQCGLCAVCGEPETQLNTAGDPKRLAVHHDHTTGNVIALLCSDCNRGMGLLKDCPMRLVNAANLQRGL